MNNIRNGYVKFVEYIFSIFLILSLNSVYYSTLGMLRPLIIVGLIGSTLVLSIYGIKQMILDDIKVNRLFLFVVFFLVYIITYSQITSSQGFPITKLQMMIMMIFPVLLIPVIYYQRNNYSLLFKMNNIIIFLAIMSLFFWFLGIMKVPTNMSYTIQWGGTRLAPGYYGLHFFPQGTVSFLGTSILRNTGIFSEAPMYAYILIIGLAMKKFILKNDNKCIDILFIVTIITTTSTTALVMLMLIYLLSYLLNIQNDSSKKHFLKYVLLILLVLIICIIINFLFMSKKEDMSGSYNLRINDVIASFKAWQQHPWIGNGMNNNLAIQQYMSLYRSLEGLTNNSTGILMILAYGGIYLLLFYLVPVLLSFNRKSMFYLQLVNFITLFFIIVPLSFMCIFILMLGVGTVIFNFEKDANIT